MANPELRARISPRLFFLVKAIAPLKNTNRDWGTADIVSEALEEWLNKPENKALIERHRLNEAMKNKRIND